MTGRRVRSGARPPSGERRGVALLLALVAVSLLSAAAVPMLAAAHAVSGERLRAWRGSLARAHADDLEPLLAEWSRQHADGAGARFFEEILAYDDGAEFSLCVRAIDLSGRLHAAELDTFAADGLPPSVRDAIRTEQPTAPRRTLSRRSSAPSPLLDEYIADDTPPLFPSPDADTHAPPTAIEWLTAHGSGALNVNGAPLALLRAALVGRDPSLGARALEHRRLGEPVPAALVAQLNGAADSGSLKRVELAASSNAFGFLITVERGGGIERFWLALEQRDGRVNSGREEGSGASAGVRGSGGWSRVERRRIEP